ncbi:MAG: isoleucine--tRNA ligase [Bacteroidetes bacterium HGW-Bacteroidetes-6]|nr:MAG: isoleucine--tRNA ligase [Bacteroidetes bacterium HGW-Bacteroidetes-6]
MKAKYNEYKQLKLTEIANDVQQWWDEKDIFRKSIETREGKPEYVFYEGPPSANGLPGIHHVMARTIKDLFCRYKTLKGFQVKRKAGWDTHGLPVEIGVEKKLGITKEHIGKTISVEDYNKECRQEVMKYKDTWDDLTRRMGYWVDLEHPYITFDNKYIESVWYLLRKLYDKDLLYKGYTIQPYSPAAGTGLSTHELNQPGCYKNVKDNTVVAQFKVVRNDRSEFLFDAGIKGNMYFLAWTTTPWTLPSNTGLAVGENVEYVLVQTYNQYTGDAQAVILGMPLLNRWFPAENAELPLDSYEAGQKNIPFKVLKTFKGSELTEIRYEQLLPYARPEEGDPFRVIPGDFVTTEDGTGIVHLAPSFGADDFRMGKKFNLGALTLVDKQGRFTEEMDEFAGKYVKAQYYQEYTPETEKDLTIDIDIVIKMKKENKAFRAEKYEHSYPHCWRTDKPVLYYPLDSWFIRTTAYRDRMIELNNTINWKPESTGSGRFGNWLENLLDWNLSRSRFWGVPLPIWLSEDASEKICIGSAKELHDEIRKSVEAGFMKEDIMKAFIAEDMSDENYAKFDLHKPYVDQIVLVSATGKPMRREPDLIDVWFDSGAMPYAQWHYPFENKDIFEKSFPADFIAEGVDQTRGWFFTLHAIATMAFDSVAYKTVVSNGLVLDKNGNKMSKRLGNGVDPFETIGKFGPDATRWYMITNSQPWDNLKFDSEGVGEVQRKFFGTLYNTYAFFALYANIDNFDYGTPEIPVAERPELDRWILSELNSLIKTVDESFADYEPTRAGRAIQHFVDEFLSNWYVRLSRRRFWKGELSHDKNSAYQTLYYVLESLAILISPIAPFFAERLFSDLNSVSGRQKVESVHLCMFPKVDESSIDTELEERMQMAQKISSMVLSLRKKTGHRVRQPLQKILIPLSDNNLQERIEAVKSIILAEVNVKELEYLKDDGSFLVKSIKADFKKLGPRFGKQMKEVAAAIIAMSSENINELETKGIFSLAIAGGTAEIALDDVEIVTEDIPGWVVMNEGNLSVALDVSLSETLIQEGIAREFINRIQNLRKDRNYEVTDKIKVVVENTESIINSINNNYSYICNEILATELKLEAMHPAAEAVLLELTDEINIRAVVEKV